MTEQKISEQRKYDDRRDTDAKKPFLAGQDGLFAASLSPGTFHRSRQVSGTDSTDPDLIIF